MITIYFLQALVDYLGGLIEELLACVLGGIGCGLPEWFGLGDEE